MYFRLIEFIYKHKIQYKKQFSFQKGTSTQHAILDLYLNIIKVIEVHEKQAAYSWTFPKPLIL